MQPRGRAGGVKHLIVGFSTKWLSFLCFPHQITHFGIKKKYIKIEWPSNRKDPIMHFGTVITY